MATRCSSTVLQLSLSKSRSPLNCKLFSRLNLNTSSGVVNQSIKLPVNQLCSIKMIKSVWIEHHLTLLKQERDAEIEASQSEIEELPLKLLESRGHVLSKLKIAEKCRGMFGRLIITLSKRTGDAVLPSNSFSSGDIVSIYEEGVDVTEPVVSGIISRSFQTKIEVAIDVDDAVNLDQYSSVRIHKVSNDVTYRRIKKILLKLDSSDLSPGRGVVSVLFCETPPKSLAPSLPPQLLEKNGEINFFNKNLDCSQRAAVEFAIKQPDLALIHGPPGTGKTSTLVEIIRQSVKMRTKILACAPSNLAVDNLAELLINVGVKVVRLGHPCRVTDKIQSRTLDSLVYISDERKLLDDINEDLVKRFGELNNPNYKNKKSIRTEVKTLKTELKQREDRISKEILSGCDVVLTTLTSAGDEGPLRLLPSEHFNLVVIDEASQTIEAACYMSIVRGPKLIMAGDHKQLPPTIISNEAAEKGLKLSLMERIIADVGDDVVHMLTVQYRMHSSIMDWASAALYNNKLTAASSVKSHLLVDLPGVESTDDTTVPLIMIDTAGCDCEELDVIEHLSKGNDGEAIIVFSQVAALVAAGVPEMDIAVITPYNLQVDLIRGLLRDKFSKVEVHSVDGFQGREKEAVVISLVRSNKKGNVGFLSEDRRLNVAVTRARRHLTVVCDSNTVSHHDFIKKFVDYIHKYGEVRTAHDFQNELDTIAVEKPSYYQIANEEVNSKTKSSVKSKNYSVNKKKNNMKKHNDTKLSDVRKVNTEDKTSIEEEKEFTDSMSKCIQDFIASDKKYINFPCDLAPFQRMLIHKISESFGLFHESYGEGKERFIVVSKMSEGSHLVDESSNIHLDDMNKIPKIIDAKVINEDDFISDDNYSDNSIDCDNSSESLIVSENTNVVSDPLKVSANNDQSESVSTEVTSRQSVKVKSNNINNNDTSESVKQCNKVDSNTCKLCGKFVPKHNFDLHSIQCQRNTQEKVKQQQQQSQQNECNVQVKMKQQQQQQQQSRKSKKKSKVVAAEKLENDDDFDSLISELKKSNLRCSQTHCKVSTSLISQQCSFCHRTFCLAHHIPEIHGCGDQAKIHARMMVSKEGVLYPGSGIPSKKPSAALRAQLQKKMDKKLDGFSSSRKSKTRDKNSKD